MFMVSGLLRHVAVLVALVFFSCALVFGQGQTGDILGIVTDATGASVPGATVTITDTDTGMARQVKTDDQGRYDATDLQIGNYQVEVSMQGFAPQVQKGVVLAIGEKLVSDFKLQVGTVTQEVTVSSTVAPQVNTTTSEVGGLVNQNQLQELPLNGRDYEQLFTLVPGVQQLTAVQTGANFGAAPRFSVAGSRTTVGSVLLDGVEIRSFWGQGGGLQIIGSSLGVEGIAEFQTMTSSFNAQYSGISVVNTVTRSGTNNFHGSVYGFFRNSAMDARGFFDPVSGPPPFHRNQFGGAVGGPIRKNKTFFFVNYEGLRDQLAWTNTEYVPDANTAQGLLPCNLAPDVACTAGLANVAAAYPTQFNTMKPYLALYPSAASVGATEVLTGAGAPTGSAEFINNGAEPQSENYISAKIDHQLTAKDNLSVRYVYDHGSETNPWQNGGNAAPPGVDPILGSFEHNPELNQYATVQDRHVFSENLINVASASFVRTHQTSSDDLSKAPAILKFLEPYGNGIMGNITVTGSLAGIGTSSYLPLIWLQNSFTEQDEVTWVHGAHSFKFGGMVARWQCNCNQITTPGGSYIFSAYSGGPASSLEAFLTARPFTLQGPLPGGQNSQRYSRQTNISGYFQDDWKLTRNLTLNLGIRDDYITNPNEATGVLWRILKLDPSTCSANPVCDGGTPEPGVSVGTQPYTRESHYFANNPSTRNIDPRIGLAWDIFGDHKTSLRAGFGIFHSLMYPREYNPGGDYAYPQIQGFTSQSAGQAPSFPDPTVNGFGLAKTTGRNQTPWVYCCTPYTQEYNAQLERQLPLGLTLDLGYVGSTSIHMVENLEENANIPVPGSQSEFRPLSPASAAANHRCVPVTICDSGYNANNDGAGLVPNTSFSYAQAEGPYGNANYNSMLVSVKRNLTNGIQLQSGYTWSRCIDYASSSPATIDDPNDSFAWLNPELPGSFNKGPCGFNATNNWTSNALLPLPFKGNEFVRGWQIGLIAVARSGNPITPTISFDNSNWGNFLYSAERPNIAGGALYERRVTFGATPATTKVQWFNPGYYTLPTPGYVGLAGRNSIVGPGFFDGDISIIKRTNIRKLGESAGIELRGDAFNILNHTNFYYPSGSVFSGATATGGTVNPSAGTITQISGNSRQLQFSARFVF